MFAPSRLLMQLTLVAVAAVAQSASAQTAKKADPQIERGRYIVKTTGCNDCHTSGYAMAGGDVPVSQWLKGDSVGWRGPWGTTYPANVRLALQKLTEDEWVKTAHTVQYRPPMPWFSLHAMTTQDLRAMYRFIKSLGDPGEPAPAYVPPDQEPKGPFIQFPAPPK